MHVFSWFVEHLVVSSSFGRFFFEKGFRFVKNSSKKHFLHIQFWNGIVDFRSLLYWVKLYTARKNGCTYTVMMIFLCERFFLPQFLLCQDFMVFVAYFTAHFLSLIHVWTFILEAGPPSKPIYYISLFSNVSRQGEGGGS